MSRFRYKARKEDGQVISAYIEASGKDEAIDKICRLGYYPIVVDQSKMDKSSKGRSKKGFFDRFHLYKDTTIFTSQLADLIKNGMPILSAISVIEEQTQNKTLKAIVCELFLRIRDGSKFSDALKLYPKCFDKFYVSMVRVGEDNGTLAEILSKISQNRKKQMMIKRKLRSALVYPSLIIIVGFFSVMFMMTHVLPKLVDLLTGMNMSLPVPTQILIRIIDFFEKNGTVLIIGIFLMLFIVSNIFKNPKNRLWYDKVKLRIPFLGKVVLKEELARFFSTFAVSLNNGLQLLSALELSLETLDNMCLKREIKDFVEKIRNGNPLGVTMKKSLFIPVMLSNMISISEESGSLPQTLTNVSQDYEEEIDEMVKTLMTLIEPAIILVLGVVVGFIVVSLLMPIFNMDILAGA